MQISELGEFGLIHHLTDTIKLSTPSTLVGIGDDCAVLDYRHRTTSGESGGPLVVTTDMLMEGIHFDLG